MHRRQRGDGLDLNDDFFAHHQIGAKRFIESNAVVNNRHRFLSLNRDGMLPHFMREHDFVNRFQQTRPQLRVHKKSRIQHDLGEFILRHSLVSFVAFV